MPQTSTPVLLGMFLSAAVVLSLPVFRTLDSSDPRSLRKLELASAAKPAPEPPVAYDVVYRRRLLFPLTLDVYSPLSASGEPAPVVVFFHGGSWVRGDKITIRIVDRFLRRMRRAGYFVVAVNYTDSALRGLQGPVDNARRAVEWVAANAEDYGFDEERIGLYGVSAGGHVALMAASAEADYRPAFVFAECAPTDLIAMCEGDAFGSSWVFRLFRPSRLDALSPIRHVSTALPPVLLSHGDADQTVHIDQSRSYADALEAVGTPVELVEYPGGDHAFLNFPDNVWYEQESLALEHFATWFSAVGGSGVAVGPSRGRVTR